MDQRNPNPETSLDHEGETHDSTISRKELKKAAEARKLNSAIQTMKGHVKSFGRRNLSDAETNLEHFLSATGKDRVLTRKQARSHEAVRNLEADIRKQLENSFFTIYAEKDEIQSKNERKLNGIKDGQSITLNSRTVSNHGTGSFLLDHGLGMEPFGRDPNFALGFGQIRLFSDA